MNATNHRPVLLVEATAGLAIKPAGIYVDATFGRGGHSEAILQNLDDAGRLLVIDKDPAAIAVAQQKFGHDARVNIVHAAFTDLEKLVQEYGWLGQIAGVLFDLGVSSPQLDDATRGFSFSHPGPLDMRMNITTGTTASVWLRQVSEAQLTQTLKEYGEERYAKRIARAIIAARGIQEITTTDQLAEIVKAAHPAWEHHRHPATRTFQAIRIAINNELTELSAALLQALHVLKPTGRLVVISFHSLEDRIVKQFMRDKARGPVIPRHVPVKHQAVTGSLRIIDSAVKPSAAELDANQRSRSAVLRIAEKI